jgi:regulator of protease activity HflC (stomatin/prohibitin superfamily)
MEVYRYILVITTSLFIKIELLLFRIEEVQILRGTVDGIAVPTKYIKINRKINSTPGCICSPHRKNSEEEWEAVEEEQEAEEAAARAKAQAEAKAKAKAQTASTVDDEEDTNSSDASNNTASLEEVTSRKRLWINFSNR